MTEYLYDSTLNIDGEEEEYFPCPPCPVCGEQTVFLLPSRIAEELRSPNRRLIQNILPTWTKVDREVILTGLHNECWVKVFGEEEDVSK